MEVNLLMDNSSYIEDLINYKSIIINKLLTSQDIIGLIANDPNIEINSESAAQWKNHIYDYNFLCDSFQTSGAYIIVEIDLADVSKSMGILKINIIIICSNDYITLDKTKFSDLSGNRKDNIAKQIDKLLNGSREFGIGKLQPKYNRTVPVPSNYVHIPNNYTYRLLTYPIPIRINKESV